MHINWGKIADVALAGASVASTVTGLGWLGIAAKGGSMFAGKLREGASAKEAGMVAFGEFVEYLQELEADRSLSNRERKAMAENRLIDLAKNGNFSLKDRQIQLALFAGLAAAKGELSLEEALALL